LNKKQERGEQEQCASNKLTWGKKYMSTKCQWSIPDGEHCLSERNRKKTKPICTNLKGAVENCAGGGSNHLGDENGVVSEKKWEQLSWGGEKGRPGQKERKRLGGSTMTACSRRRKTSTKENGGCGKRERGGKNGKVGDWGRPIAGLYGQAVLVLKKKRIDSSGENTLERRYLNSPFRDKVKGRLGTGTGKGHDQKKKRQQN